MKNLGKKMGLVLATTAVGVTMFAAIASAAVVVDPPALPAGLTAGGPHDIRGVCTLCHAYETGVPAPATAPVVVLP